MVCMVPNNLQEMFMVTVNQNYNLVLGRFSSCPYSLIWLTISICLDLKGIPRYQWGRQKSLSRKTDKTMANKMKRKTNIEHTTLH